MIFDYSKLRGRIVEKYGTQCEFAKAFGISNNSMSRKLNNKNSFSVDDIIKITQMLDIQPKDVSSYFFTEKV